MKLGVRAQMEATRDNGRRERGVPDLMRRECTNLSSNGELNLCNSSRVSEFPDSELCKLCFLSIMEEGIAEHDTEGKEQTIAASKIVQVSTTNASNTLSIIQPKLRKKGGKKINK